ncbi:MAG TPA: carboxypeptidase M32 [Bacteroidetes bacterium]|nr:carboxypeptidase M32 [Bacteroidota bacterium]
MKAPYQALLEAHGEIALLSSIEDLLAWDNRTYMPKAAAAYRADQIAYLTGLTHGKRTDPRIGDLLAELNAKGIDPGDTSVEAVNLREWRREYDRLVKLPTDLMEERSRIVIQAQEAWLTARQDSDFSLFKPWLEKTIEINIKIADCLGYEKEPYDALLDEYEPGAVTSEVAVVLNSLRDELVPLIRAIGDASRKPDTSILKRDFPVQSQREFAVEAAKAIGYSFDKGRLDETAHPFCIDAGPEDTRITTHFEGHFFPKAFFSVMHEAGHGIYNQNLPGEHWGTPMGEYVSLGIHESQSRLWENLVGRNRAFWEYWYKRAQKRFPALNDVSLDDFHFAINEVKPSLIRIEADEVTYNLHIMLRFELERAMLNGDLSAADVPAAWNEKVRSYLGVDVPDDSQGCLQDIHWSGGMIGYFPTYTLGNLNAAQLYEKAAEEIGDLDAMFRAGEFTPLREWLTDKVHSQGKRYRSDKLIEVITGKPLDASSLVRYLRSKFGELYNL